MLEALHAVCEDHRNRAKAVHELREGCRAAHVACRSSLVRKRVNERTRTSRTLTFGLSQAKTGTWAEKVHNTGDFSLHRATFAT
jgi:hypothetical protein